MAIRIFGRGLLGLAATLVLFLAQGALALPTVTLTSPTAGQTFVAPAAITLRATATPTSGKTITKVEFYRGGTTLIGTVTGSTTPHTFNWPSAAAGSYSITARAYDSVGNTTSNPAVAIIVNALPTVSILSPANAAVLAAPANIVITVAASDSDGAITKVEILSGASVIATLLSPPFTTTVSNAAAGAYSFTARATDDRSGVTTSSPATAITVRTPPIVTLTAPANGVTFAFGASITLSATASAATGGSVSNVKFFDGATQAGTTDTTTPYSVAWTGAAAGAHHVTAVVTDSTGLTRTSATADITVNAPVPPTVSLTAPVDNTILTAGASITISANAAAGSGTLTNVTFKQNGTQVGTPDTTTPYSISWTNVPAGSYDLTAVALNSNGATTISAIRHITVNPPPPPIVTFNLPADGATFTPGSNITLTATATAGTGTLTSVTFKQNGTQIGSPDTSTPYSVTWNAVPAGTYQLTAVALNSGGVQTTSAIHNITVAPPHVSPTVTMTAPASGSVYAAPANIVATATATKDPAATMSVKIFNGSTQIATGTTSPLTTTLANTPAGGYLLRATVTDSFQSVVTSPWTYAIVDGTDTCLTTPPLAQNDSATKLAAFGKLPLTFEANAGQAHQDVRYLQRGPGYQLFLTPTERVLALRDATANEKPVALRMKFLDANPDPAMTGLEEAGARTNYLVGNDPSQWHSRVSNFAKVRYAQIYPGIDEVYRSAEGKLESDLHVAPGADPARIRFAIDGTKGVKVDGEGNLLIPTAHGVLVQNRPIAYQEIEGVRQPVVASYRLLGLNKVAFDVGRYDTRQELIIDPVLVYSTYVGGATDMAEATGIAISRCGEAFITGWTWASDYPTTAGAFDPASNAGIMGFVSKLNQSGSALLYSTYVTGTVINPNTGSTAQVTQPAGIAVDGTGHAYIVGSTEAPDFPVTSGSWNTTPPTSATGFVAKLNTDGSALIYSSFVAVEGLTSVAVDGAGNAYFTGDRLVWKLDPTGATQVYQYHIGTAVFYGGSRGIAVDGGGNAFVVGYANTSDILTTANVFQTTKPSTSGSSGFVVKINPAGNGLVYGTYLGTQGNLTPNAIAIDAAGSAYITGSSDSSVVPNFGGGAMFNLNVDHAGNDYAFFAKLAPDASHLNYFARLGGSFCNVSTCSFASTVGMGIAVDSTGSAWVTGPTNSNELPMVKALYPTRSATTDSFVAKLSPSGTTLLYSSLMGGQAVGTTHHNSLNTGGAGIQVDSVGSAYVAGTTDKLDYPTTVGAYQTASRSNLVSNVFVTKINETKDTTTTLAVSPTSGTVGSATTLTATVTGNAPSGTVSFFDGTTSLGTAPFSGTTAQLATTQLAGGLHSLTAAYSGDAHNNPSSSAATSYSVADPTGAVTVSISGVAEGATLFADSTGVDARLVLTVTSSAASGNTISSVSVATTVGTYSWTGGTQVDSTNILLSNMYPRLYTAVATAVDNFGHSGSSPVLHFVVNPASTTAPTVSITSPANGATLTAPGSFPLSATAAATGATIQSVTYYAGSLAVGSSPTIPYSATFSNPSAGSYALLAVAADTNGARAISAPVNVTVTSPPPPSVSLTSPAINSTWYTTQTIPLAATATAAGGANMDHVEFYTGTILIGTVPAPLPYTLDWTTAGAGTHSLTARAYDNHGVSASSTPVTITVNAPVAPTIAITSPASGATFSSPANIPITVNATPATGATITKVDFFDGSAPIGTATATPFGFTWPNASVGSHSISALATDSRQATATSAAVPVSVTFGQPIVAADAGLDGLATTDASVLITGTIVAPPNSGVTVNGELATLMPNGAFFRNDVSLQPGSNSINLTVTTQDMLTASQTIVVNRTSDPSFQVTIDQAEGFPGMQVTYKTSGQGAVPIASIEFDVNGDGVSDLTSIGPNAEAFFTFNSPGSNRSRISFKDASGNVIYTATKMVYVYDPRDTYALVKGVYSDAIDRLKAGNNSSALNLFFPQAQLMYGNIFTALGTDLPTLADQLGAFTSISATPMHAEAVITRNVSGANQIFMVYLFRGEDGVWRIESM